VARAPLWIALALVIGYFFPAIGALMLNPFGAIIIALVVVALAASVVEDDDQE